MEDNLRWGGGEQKEWGLALVGSRTQGVHEEDMQGETVT